MPTLDQALISFNDFVWGPPMLVLLIGGGIFFSIYSRFAPYRYFKHAFQLLTGRYDNPEDGGDLSHKEALATALSGTVGMGNIAGVAMAISLGGPGAVFWMWVTALLGIGTKFFTCTLSVMYRGKDTLGQLQGGPMYVIREALGPRFYPLAIMFSVAGLFGVLPVFQTNQLVEAIREEFIPSSVTLSDTTINFSLGLIIALIVARVVFGGLKRMAKVAVKLVPTMAIIYLAMTLWVLVNHYDEVPALLLTIVTDAFTAEAAGGGLLGVMIIGISRGAFSNEAGIGTEAMAHGAAKTNEPVREGLVAMLGPVIDTLLICTCTALVILLTGVWQETNGVQGISLTLAAYRLEMGAIGQALLGLQIAFLSLTTMFVYWYYGAKCLGFLIGAEYQHYYKYFHVSMVLVGATLSIEATFNLLSGMYALMAIPTMVSSLLLAPKVRVAANDYFRKLKEN